MSKPIAKLSMLVVLLLIVVHQQLSAQCNAIAGTTFQFSASDYNTANDYSNQYVLTDYTGTILQSTDKTEFVIPEKGLYKIYGINYRKADGIYDINIGQSYKNIKGGCIEIGDPLEVLACNSTENICDIFDGNFSFNSTGANPALFTVFILTNLDKEIIMTNTTPEFNNIPVGDFLIFPVNYVELNGLVHGNSIDELTGNCYDIGNPLMLSSCLPCSVTLGEDIELCGSQTVVISSSSETNGTFTWNTGQTGSSIVVTPKQSTTYIVNFKSIYGCTAVDSIHVTIHQKPVVNAGTDKTICQGENTILSIDSIPGGSYLWSTGDTTRSIIVSPSVTSSYTIQVDKGICSAYDEIVVNVNSSPVATIEGNNYICKGESTVLKVKGGSQFVWNTGDTSDSITVAPLENTSYIVTVTSNAGCTAIVSTTVYTDKCGRIGNLVWDDLNGNGIKENNEPGIPGIDVILYDGETEIASTQTDIAGNYLFEGLAPSTYKLKFIAPTGFIPTVPLTGNENTDSDYDPLTGLTRSFRLEDQEKKLNIFAGFIKPGIVGQYIWEDINSNGIQDDDESGISGVEILLEGTDGAGRSVSVTEISDAGGIYSFKGIYPGNYIMSFILPAEYKVSPLHKGSDNQKDNDIDSDRQLKNVIIHSGFSDLSIGAGFYRCAKVSGYVWNDTGDQTGIQDDNDKPLNNIEIQLYETSKPEVPVQTTLSQKINNKDGQYEFEVCKPGNYFIKVIKANDYKFVTPFAGHGINDSKISDSINGTTDSFYIGYANLIAKMDFGLVYSPLPVAIVNFRGHWNVDRDVNVLQWKTNSEINNDHFILERSFEMEPFVQIAQIKGQGNSTQTHEYKYDDPDIQRNGIYSYRLKQVDFDGQITYTEIVKIAVFRVINGFTTTLYPNPTVDRSTLEIHSYKGIKIKVEVFDAVGRLCYPFVFDSVLDADIIKIPLDKGNLPKGMYHIKVSSDDQISTLKWLIIK